MPAKLDYSRLSTPEGRYRNDVAFRAIVDLLEGLIHRAELSPHEVREAAMLAAIHYEMRRSPVALRVAQIAGDLHADPSGPPPVVIVDGVTYTRQP